MKKYFQQQSLSKQNNLKIAVIGTGLAGSALAYELSKSNKITKIDIFDKNNKIASQASGNIAGLIRPYITNDNNFSEQFHTSGFHLISDFINDNKKYLDIYSKGMIHILSEDKELQRYKNIFSKRKDINDNLAQFLSPLETSNITNNKINKHSVYYPNAISIKPSSLCKRWLELSKANIFLNKELLNYQQNDNSQWILNFKDNSQNIYDVVIFAGGYEQFITIEQLNKFNVYPAQGQVTITKNFLNLEKNIIDKGYIIPNINGKQLIGATFRDNSDTLSDIRKNDDLENLSHISRIFSQQEFKGIEILESRVSTRCVISDHLPIIGHIAEYNQFYSQFYKAISMGYPQSKLENPNYLNGIYLCSGFGSKGLCSSLLSAKIIASMILNENLPITDKLYQALHPLRFWVRNFKKK